MISKTALHALKAAMVLAEEPEGFHGTAKIAAQIGAPPNYLGKLLQNLVQCGVLESQKGLGGGFRLARQPEKLFLYDVVEPIDHVSRWAGCIMGRSTCSAQSPCALHEEWADVRNRYLSMLQSNTLAMAVKKNRLEGDAS